MRCGSGPTYASHRAAMAVSQNPCYLARKTSWGGPENEFPFPSRSVRAVCRTWQREQRALSPDIDRVYARSTSFVDSVLFPAQMALFFLFFQIRT